MAEQLTLELEGIDRGRGALRAASERLVTHLRDADRLTTEHLPIVALLFKLADALEVSGGRGASVAMLSAQFQEVWERLATAPEPEVEDDEDEFDVDLLVPVLPDAG